jgi:TolA-binding protein
VDTVNISGIIVALIGIISAWLAARAAQKAAKSSADASMSNERVKAETEAYQRARKMDTDTIARQDEELKELREEIASVRTKNRELERQNELLRLRVSALEGKRRHG